MRRNRIAFWLHATACLVVGATLACVGAVVMWSKVIDAAVSDAVDRANATQLVRQAASDNVTECKTNKDGVTVCKARSCILVYSKEK